MRRLRAAPWSRRLVAESRLGPQDLVYPMFVIDGEGTSEDVPSMPGVQRHTIDRLVDAARQAADLGIPMVAIFPKIDQSLKNAEGSEAVNPDNLVCRATAALKDADLGMGVMCDLALDPFTDHGHDGLLKGGVILNDETIEVLCAQAVVQAKAGCDVIAPSDMMDGRIGAVRAALDGAGFQDVILAAYTAKYASAFYGPFRDAVGSGTVLAGDKKTYQMDPANGDEALREVALDLAEGADMVLVKPGMPYLDIVHRVKAAFGAPTLAYQVSGEYSMILAAVERGWMERDRAILESLLGFKRAGADAILTYFALEAARLLQDASTP
ncbi:MAG: porphobilinogen synthase [Alphaproteobacteria bacterium]|nr:porphobilinogen synthase [Alphaproteobacteria bacterium]MBT5860371.1 porphobilinogen synthase [Alphaproteobacteria bacterium]